MKVAVALKHPDQSLFRSHCSGCSTLQNGDCSTVACNTALLHLQESRVQLPGICACWGRRHKV